MTEKAICIQAGRRSSEIAIESAAREPSHLLYLYQSYIRSLQEWEKLSRLLSQVRNLIEHYYYNMLDR